MMRLHIEKKLQEDFPEISVLVREITGVLVKNRDEQLEIFKQKVFDKLRKTYFIEDVKNLPVIRQYRSFYWRLGIDPTKTRPAGEALLRRILLGKDLPTINTLVDAYNLASAETGVAISALDREKIKGELVLRYSRVGELFFGMGMSASMLLDGGRPIICDDEKVVALYPYRDSELTKITEETTKAVLIFCGVPGIENRFLQEVAEKTITYIKRFCGGEEIQQ
ncbi:MAG: phenylalanine--tRNA ligase beta subunit-related protein [Candidatus Hadarchaeales archaeon]